MCPSGRQVLNIVTVNIMCVALNHTINMLITSQMVCLTLSSGLYQNPLKLGLLVASIRYPTQMIYVYDIICFQDYCIVLKILKSGIFARNELEPRKTKPKNSI
jgi:hypothetical protein